MLIVKLSEKVQGLVDNIYNPLCVGLYKEEDYYLVPWSETDPEAKMNCFTWSKYDNNWIVLEYHYNEDFNN